MTMFDDAVRLAECVCAALMDETRGDDAWTGDCCVMPGSEIPWDLCCENGRGQAWVAILSGSPNATQIPGSPCFGGTTDVRYQIGALRCTPVAGACQCDCQEESARKILGDLQALIKAAYCCFQVDENGDESCEKPTITSWRTVGPQGGCAGAVVELTFPTPSGACC